MCSNIAASVCDSWSRLLNAGIDSITNNAPTIIPSLDIIKGLNYFADHQVLENIIPNELKEVTSFISETKILGHAMDVVDATTTFFSKIPKNIEQRKKAKESGDVVKIVDADLGAVRIAGKMLGYATKIVNFISENFFKVESIASGIAAAVGKVCSVASMIFSFAEILQHKLHYDTTHEFMGDLKRERHMAFIKSYCEKLQTSPKEPLGKASSAQLKTTVKAIKATLSNSLDSTLSDIKKVADRAFIDALTNKMAIEPEVFTEHFNAKIKKEGSPIKENSSKLGANFKEKLSSLAAQGDAHKLANAVKIIKQQGRRVERSHIFSMVLSGINCVKSVVNFTLGAINPFIIPVTTGISIATSITSLVKAGVEKNQSKQFVKEMKEVLA
jgi:hypothetical protein